MLDRSIPYYNIIMRCDSFRPLPENTQSITVRNYRHGDEKHWAEIEYSIGDFPSVDEAERYFKTHYTDEIFERCFFAEDKNKNVIGTCIAWRDLKDKESVSSLHWLAVDPKYQNNGAGKALLNAVMTYYFRNQLMPVYLHTQPWSYKAIKLYLSTGFKIMKTDTFSDYKNEYEKGIKVLSEYLPFDTICNTIQKEVTDWYDHSR